MSARRAASWLAWALAGLSVAIFLASGAFYVLDPSARSPGNWLTVGTISDMLSFVSFLAFPLVGALIASRRPYNPIGWMCLVVDRKSTRLNSSHANISYAVFCLKKKITRSTPA